MHPEHPTQPLDLVLLGVESALEADGQVREGAEVAELTGLLYGRGANYPEGTRFLVRRERPHPGAQLSLFDTIEGFRHQAIATDTPLGAGPLTWIEARHRAHARVEDRIRCGKDAGFGRFPSRVFAINAAWLELALTGIDLVCWMQMLLLDGELALAEPQKDPLPAPARRRQDHQVGQVDAAAHRRTLALGETAGHSLRAPRRTATADHLLKSTAGPSRHAPKEPGRTRPQAPGPRHARRQTQATSPQATSSDYELTRLAKDGG